MNRKGCIQNIQTNYYNFINGKKKLERAGNIWQRADGKFTKRLSKSKKHRKKTPRGSWSQPFGGCWKERGKIFQMSKRQWKLQEVRMDGDIWRKRAKGFDGLSSTKKKQLFNVQDGLRFRAGSLNARGAEPGRYINRFSSCTILLLLLLL